VVGRTQVALPTIQVLCGFRRDNGCPEVHVQEKICVTALKPVEGATDSPGDPSPITLE
jgi:hypothetical protein